MFLIVMGIAIIINKNESDSAGTISFLLTLYQRGLDSAAGRRHGYSVFCSTCLQRRAEMIRYRHYQRGIVTALYSHKRCHHHYQVRRTDADAFWYR